MAQNTTAADLALERGAAKRKEEKYLLRLYVTGSTPRS